MSKWVWFLLLFLLIVGIFYFQFSLKSQIFNEEMNLRVDLSEGYFWAIMGIVFVLGALIIIVFLKNYPWH